MKWGEIIRDQASRDKGPGPPIRMVWQLEYNNPFLLYADNNFIFFGLSLKKKRENTSQYNCVLKSILVNVYIPSTIWISDGPMFPFVLKEMRTCTSISIYVLKLFLQLYSPTKVKTQTEGKKLDFMTLAPA